MNKRILLTPGPSNVPPPVLEAMARPIIHHRSPDFDPIFEECRRRLQYVFRTENPVLTFAGSGTGAMEAAVTGTLSPGDTMIHVEGGKFGQRWGDIGKAHGLNVITLEIEWGTAIAPEAIEQVLGSHPEAKAVFTTLCETSTAALTDIQAIGPIVAKTDAILVVDAISGLAADALETDQWQVDMVVGGSQKALMLPPGLAFLSVSSKARGLTESARCASYYFNLRKALKSLGDNTTAFTPAISLIQGLIVALTMIETEGLPRVWGRHAGLANALRAGGVGLGLELFSQAPSNTAVAYRLPEGVAYKDLSLRLRDDHGITIAGGQDHLKGKIFRAAAMGYADFKDVYAFLASLERVLGELGHEPPAPGSGVAGALEATSQYQPQPV